MSVSIEVSNEQLAALKARAAAQGLTLQDWLKKLADEESEPSDRPAVQVWLRHAGEVRPGTVS
jgi:hypothetical protein